MKYWIGVFIFYLVLGQAFSAIKAFNEEPVVRTLNDAQLEQLVKDQLDPEFGKELWCK